MLKNGGQDPSRAEDLLLRALKANHLVRSGPEHRIFSGTKEQILNVAYPVVDPLDRKLDLRRDMRVASYSVGTLLTLVVREASEKKLAAAEALLRKQAREDHETPAGGARRVIWSQTVTQVQLPLR